VIIKHQFSMKLKYRGDIRMRGTGHMSDTS